jgi:hypothetical protein
MGVPMPISFFVYLLGVFGFMVSVITANHTLDTVDYIYSDWMDVLMMAYFDMTFAFVCWWGAMMRLEVTVACYVLQLIVATMINVMTTAPAVYDVETSLSLTVYDIFVVEFVMAIIFLLVHGIGSTIRFIVDMIVMRVRRYRSV